MTLRPDRKRSIFIGIFAVATVAVLLATRSILLPFILALVIAYVLTPAVSLVERTKVPRWVAVLIVYTVTLGAVYGFFSLVTPRLVQETIGLRKELPGLSVKLRDKWVPAIYRKARALGIVRAATEPEPEPHAQANEKAPDPDSTFRVERNPDGSYDVRLNTEVEVRAESDRSWRLAPIERTESQKPRFDLAKMIGDGIDKAMAYGRRNIVEVLRFGSSIVARVSRGVFLFFLTLMLAGYIMISREQVLEFFRVLVRPAQRASFDLWLRRIDRGLAGVVRGQLLICLVNGILSAIGFVLIDLKYWPILAVVAGVMSIIPIFGSILSSVPAVAIGLTQGIGTGLAVFVWIVGIHQVEANLLNPKIYGIAAKIHPVLVIFALLVGEHFFGLVGALLAVPCMSIIQNTFLHFRTVALGPDAPTDSFAGVPIPQTLKEMKDEPRKDEPRKDEPRKDELRKDEPRKDDSDR